MNNKNSKLREIIDQFPLVWEDSRRIRAMLMDMYPEDKLTRNLILACVDERVPHDIYDNQSCDRFEINMYAHKVVDAYGCSVEKAREIVYLWADALKIHNIPSKSFLYPGHEKCETLRTIRKKIAEANNIVFEPKECTHDGPCSGTCPACDAELQYFDRELQKKKDRGEPINIDGIAADEIERAKINIPENEEIVSMGAPVVEGDFEIPMGVDLGDEFPFD